MKTIIACSIVVVILLSFGSGSISAASPLPLLNRVLDSVGSSRTSTSKSETSTSPQAGSSFGAITGVVTYPSEELPPMRIYAISIDGGAHFQTNTRGNQSKFTIRNVPPGTYYVVAYAEGSPVTSGAWSRAVPCGLKVTCTNHSLISVNVISGKTSGGVNVGDWYAPTGAFPSEPSPDKTATATSAIRSLDFKNFTYNEGSQDLALRDGKEEGAGTEGSRLLNVEYLDFDGDGKEEALVTLASGARGAQGYGEEYFVYAIQGGSPRQIFRESRQKPHQMTVNGRSIVIVAPFWSSTDPGCCPSAVETAIYSWRDSALVRVSRQLRPIR